MTLRTIFKKSILITFLLITGLYVGTFLHFNDVFANNYQDSSSWNGSDIGVSPLTNITYESNYKSFDVIMNDSSLIDTNKTYVIETAYQLYMLSEASRSADQSQYLSLDYVLGNDIDYFDALRIDYSYLFVPIGFTEAFSGSFDGQGFEITNLIFMSVNNESSYETYMNGLIYYAMFSKISSTGSVKNLGLINPLIVQPLNIGGMTHMSTLVGLNQGLVENVYYIDTREDSAGINADGEFLISGLVSVNQGTIDNAYVASPYIKSRAVYSYISSNVITYSNSGTMNQVYYDVSILEDDDSSRVYGSPLTTENFSNHSYFSNAWYFSDSYEGLTDNTNLYSQLEIDQTYPILKGLDVSNETLLINDAVDFVYMNKLFDVSGFYRSATYVINHDIDMKQVSSDAYQAASIGFSGLITSSLASESSSLYTHSDTQGGAYLYHTIFNLTISKATAIGNYASYALFAAFFGGIEHLNFYNYTIETNDISDMSEKDYIYIGGIAANAENVVINDVHLDLHVTFNDQSDNLGTIYAAGLIATGDGDISYVSTTGTISEITTNYDARSNGSIVSGIVAYSEGFTIKNTLNNLNLGGLSYNTSPTGINYYGGIVGYGSVITLDKIVNLGDIYANQSGIVNDVYLGGIYGKQINLEDSISYIYNRGDLNLLIDQNINAYIAGYGYITDSTNDIDLISVTNAGDMNVSANTSMSEAVISQMNVHVASTLIAQNINGSIKGVFNTASYQVDLSLVHDFAGAFVGLSQSSLSVEQVYQSGDFDFYTTHVMSQEDIHVAGAILGERLDLNHIRQTGDLTIVISHQSSTSLIDPHFYLYGVFEEVSNYHNASNIYQSGAIDITLDSGITFTHELNIAGVTYANRNVFYYTRNQVDYNSVDFVNRQGSLDTVINNGSIDIRGDFYGSVLVSGVTLYNYSMMTNIMNLSDITIHDNIQTTNESIEVGGLTYAMIGRYAQLRDSANNGDIIAVSNTQNGFVNASGAVATNTKLEDGQTISTGSNHQYAKILFTMNYGDIYAYNAYNESTNTLADETRSKASGIFGTGILSIVNTVNYGNILSNYLASGILGMFDYSLFNTISTNEVFISNSMNYGKVRRITSYNEPTETLFYDLTVAPTNSYPYQFGAIIAKIHTGNNTWSFNSSSDKKFTNIFLSYLINFDDKINMIDQAPDVTDSAAWVLNGFADNEAANIAIHELVKNLATTNPNDQSIAPFREFDVLVQSGGGSYHLEVFGEDIKSYDFTDTDTGIFSEDYQFRSQVPSYSGTDQYIFDFIEYIPRDKVNSELITQLELNTTNYYTGIYALSSTKGIENGIFIPDNFDFEGLNPYNIDDSNADTTWIGQTTDQTSIAYKLYVEMRQIQASIATTIYDLEIEQVDINGNPVPNGLTLKNPVIDQERGLLTYYLPNNAAILSNQTSNSFYTSSFVEVTEGMSGAYKIADVFGSGATVNDITYTYVGQYRKVGLDFYQIGPYNTTGIYYITGSSGYNSNKTTKKLPFGDNYYGSLTGLSTIGGVSTIYSLNPYIIVETNPSGAVTYGSEGYSLSYTQGSAGYQPYKLVSMTNYSQPVLTYVGPSTELVTYMSQPDEYKTTYNDNGVRFMANTSSNYMISDGASLEFNQVALTSNISVPYSMGIYDSMYDQNGNYIDSVEDHYGSVRVYSSDYNVSDPTTYKDYDIRIIRTEEENITDIASIYANGNDAMPQYYTTNDVTVDTPLFYRLYNDYGTLSITYDAINLAPNQNLLDQVEVFDYQTSVKIQTSYYRLSDGIVQNSNTFDSANGIWGDSQVTIVFSVDESLQSGAYYLKLTLINGDSYYVNFTKQQSSEASLITAGFNGEVFEINDEYYETEIPYGIYYNPDDPTTHYVDFTNLDTYTNVYYDEVSTNLPSYLDSLEVSYFATIVSIDFSMNIIDGYRHQYVLYYTIQAENGSIGEVTHVLTESALDSKTQAIYQDGASLTLPISQVDVGYEESPTIRVIDDLENAYFSDSLNALSVTDTFIPLDGSSSAINGVDYYIKTLDQIGYEIDLNDDSPKGTYLFTLSYNQSVNLYGQTLTWNYTFDTVTVVKHKNDNSKLNNILFASDSVFDEVLDAFVTIIDIEEVSASGYISYFDTVNPTERIINVLPTYGIDYNSYDSEDAYWVIGQVQQTDLSTYVPTFFLPDGASIYRVTDQDHIDYTYQSETLSADYTDFGDGETLHYVQYRIYAEDYDDDPTHYTDFYVAVQDATNNIRFDITVVNDTNEDIDRVYVLVNVYQFAEDYEGDLTYDDILISMGLFSYYDSSSDSYTNNQFKTTMYGYYMIFVDTPEGISYEIEFEASVITGGTMYLESSRIPRRYYVTIHLVEETPNTPSWGYEEIIDFTPPALPIDVNHTYEPGDVFIYNDVTWTVVSGNYVYDPYNPPGTGAWQGLQDTSGVYNPTSAYLDGDIVYYNGTYYEALNSSASYSNPVSGLGNSWNEVSEEWLSYNLYTTGDIVLYNGVYYISTAGWNKGWAPDVTTWAWQVYTP